MILFFEMLFAALPYIVMFICFWLIANRFDEMQHTVEVMKKYINAHDKKFAALQKKAQPTKKK
jgi:hypothetical protein